MTSVRKKQISGCQGYGTLVCYAAPIHYHYMKDMDASNNLGMRGCRKKVSK